MTIYGKGTIVRGGGVLICILHREQMGCMINLLRESFHITPELGQGWNPLSVPYCSDTDSVKSEYATPLVL